jgi:membrane-associated phospholipid phosphatase
MTGVINAEKLIARGIAPVALQGALFGGHTIGPFEKFQVAVHAAHFFVFLVFGMWVWLVRREHFHKFTVSMLALMYLGLVAFLVFPTVPPWMASLGYRAIPPLVKIRSVVYDSSLPVIQAGLDTNPIAAMPSLHAAFAMLCCLIGLHLFKKRAWPLVVYTGLVAFAIIYLGEHYLVDVLAGWVLSAIIYWIVFRWRRAERFTTRQSGNSGRITEVKFLVPACLIILIGAEALAHLRDRIRVPYLPTRSFIDSSAITATAPASSAILACSALVTSMMTPPFNISARPTFTRNCSVLN